MVLKGRATDAFLVDEDCGEAILDAFSYFLLENETVDAALVIYGVVVANGENVEIHLGFDALAMEDVSWPVANYLLVVARIEISIVPGQAAVAFFVWGATFIIEYDRSVVIWSIDIAYLLFYFIVVIRHLLIDDEASVQVVVHELFNPPKL